MIVTFISQCEKKALNRTRRVLDAFSERIGERTWQTIITEEGLLAVKKLLHKTATKNTAVSCHWIRSRSRTELLWIVGNRNKFNSEGIIPVNSTKKKLSHSDWENTWHFLPSVKALAAMAALLHDWGKANNAFQTKLRQKQNNVGDPLRHEWISCLLIRSLIDYSGDNQTDSGWLMLFAKGNFDQSLTDFLVNSVSLYSEKNPLDDLPPLAAMVCWIILSHHRLPTLRDGAQNQFAEEYAPNINTLLTRVDEKWGYQNIIDDENKSEKLQKLAKQSFIFPYGLLLEPSEENSIWHKQLAKWSKKLLLEQDNILTVLKNNSWRLILQHARLSVMLADHFYSSRKPSLTFTKAQQTQTAFANTDKDKNNRRIFKQTLVDHLLRVTDNALFICQRLSSFTSKMDAAHDVRVLKKKSSKGYEWQDKAVDAITAFKKQQQKQDCGWFVVNMASTGCGKTFANAKIMRALSEDGDRLRYILALGLRTLTMQTGDEYRESIGLNEQEMATLIGSAAVKELHDQARKNQGKNLVEENESGSESEEFLLDEEFSPSYELNKPIDEKFLEAVIKKAKDQIFLYVPVLSCTIDHLMVATETTRGGKYILPYLRLLSSDLVIDEVDDFDGKDLIAIGRLIHLAGMLGQKVAISSATIAPAVAEGLFNAYQAGWQIHSQAHNLSPQIACAWVDEHSSNIKNISIKESSQETCEQYQLFHKAFIQKRVEFLGKQPIKRIGKIVPCDSILLNKENKSSEESIENAYFDIIKTTVLELHQAHHTIDKKTNKKVSFGVVRMANIPPCINLAHYLINADYPENYAPKVMAYHSRQVLLLRHEQEQHLDQVLKRKKPDWQDFSNPIIRHHLDSTSAENIVFILVATPVEEVGRDHDFDWAIIEPSSYRSLIQLAGRVLRHRSTSISEANIAIMQYNLRALKTAPKESKNPKNRFDRVKKNTLSLAFTRPGYEEESLRLTSHNLIDILDEPAIGQRIDALPRITEPNDLNPTASKTDSLINLEHLSLYKVLKSYEQQGPKGLQAWLSECWWMSALPQQFNRFRQNNNNEVLLYYLYQDGELMFYERDDKGDYIPKIEKYDIEIGDPLDELGKKRLWLTRNYECSLKTMAQEQIKNGQSSLEEASLMAWLSKKYGEITLPVDTDKKANAFYCDQFGLKRKR